MFFSEDDDRPRLVWLDITKGSRGGLEVTLTGLCDATDFGIHHLIHESLVLHRPLGTIIMTGHRYRDIASGCIDTYRKPNNSFSKIDPELVAFSLGPLLAIGVEFGDEIPMRPVDLDLADFRHLIDQLRFIHDFEWRRHWDAQGAQGVSVKGVRVNCKGDQFVMGYPAVKALNMPYSFVIPPGRDAIPRAPRKLGLELVLARLKPRLSWRNRTVDNGVMGGTNCCFPWFTASMFSDSELTQPFSQGTIGSFVRARADGKTLFPQHVEAIGQYLRIKAGGCCPKGVWVDDGQGGLVSREDFERFWAEWAQKNAGGDEVSSPYDM